MDLTPYVDSLRRDLHAAAAAGDTEFQAMADRLAAALDPASRLALMEAISHAAAEITAALPLGSVEVRLDGRDLDFVVEQALAEAPEEATARTPPDAPDDGDLARVSLRLPESLKTRAEEQAAATGVSLNTWLVGVIRSATRAEGQAVRVDVDLTSRALDRGDRQRPGGPRRVTGWL